MQKKVRGESFLVFLKNLGNQIAFQILDKFWKIYLNWKIVG